MLLSEYFLFAICLGTSIAFKVTLPDVSTVWSSTVPQSVAWDRVDTDPTSFAIVLSFQGASSALIIASVDATKGSVEVTPPPGGFPVKDGLRLNLVQDDTNPNSILAQSDRFDVISGANTSLSDGTSPSSAGYPGSSAAALATGTPETFSSASPQQSVSSAPSPTSQAVSTSTVLGPISVVMVLGCLISVALIC